MDPLIIKIIVVAFWIFSFSIRIPHARQNKSNKIVKSPRTNQEKALLAGAFLGMMLLPILFVFTPVLGFADYDIPFHLQIAGILFLPPALWFFYRSHKDLGQNWSAALEIRSGHTLITNGVYKRIRHPMYTSIWLAVIGQALLLNNYIAGFSGIVSFGILYFLRIHHEESMMEEQFGEQYKAYKKETNRLTSKF